MFLQAKTFCKKKFSPDFRNLRFRVDSERFFSLIPARVIPQEADVDFKRDIKNNSNNNKRGGFVHISLKKNVFALKIKAF